VNVNVLGTCDKGPVRAAYRKQIRAFDRCIGEATGYATLEVTAPQAPVKAKGSLPPQVLRCLESRVQKVMLPAGDCRVFLHIVSGY